MLNQVMLAVKKLSLSEALKATDTLKKFFEHAKTSSLIDLLCLSLAASGTDQSGSDNLLCAASEGCIALWCLVDSLENLAVKEKSWSSPLTSLCNHLSVSVDVKDYDSLPDTEIGSEMVVVSMTRAFVNSEAVRVALHHCLRQRDERVLISTIQLLLRCCMHSEILPSVLCGLPISLPVATYLSGGGDETFVSEIFSVISLCGSYMNKDSPAGDTKHYALALHSCLLLATIAQSFYSTGRNSAVLVLTSSLEKQKSRLSSLACLCSVNDCAFTSIKPLTASAMLAFASILWIGSEASIVPSISDIALPLLPHISTLCDFLKMDCKDKLENNCAAGKYMLPCVHGLRDGCVGLIRYQLIWGGPLAPQQFCATGLRQLLDLLGKDLIHFCGTECLQDLVWLSPVGAAWAVSCLRQCLSSGFIAFQQMMLEKVHVKCINDLLSSAHLQLRRFLVRPGEIKNGLKEIINEVLDILAFPFGLVENTLCSLSINVSMNNGFLLTARAPAAKVCWGNEDIKKVVKESLKKYVEILLELGVPIQVLQCADSLGLEDTRKPVAFLAKMMRNKALAICLVLKGMLEAARMRRLLDCSSPKEVILDMLTILSELARMDARFYEYIERADIMICLKELLISNDCSLRAKACSVVGNMCRHSSYFYNSLARHGIISLLIDRCTDSDNLTRKFACFAVGNAAFYNDKLYEELRRSISPLTKLLLSTEEDVTKANAAAALSNLVGHSDKLCDDIISNGVIQALLKVVCEYSKPAWNSPNSDAFDLSPLKNALWALAKMCSHYSPCGDCILTSESFQVIEQLQQVRDVNVAKYARFICIAVGEAPNLSCA